MGRGSGEGLGERLNRRVWLPWLVLLLLPIVLQLPFLLAGVSTDPIWFTSGVTQSAPPLLPTQPFLDPNVGFTSEALGHLAAWDWVHGVVPWWNPYTGVGMPLAGELQPGAFFLPFNLLLLLPEGLLLLRLIMQIIAGLTTYALLRELGLSRLAALTGGILYQLNGTMAWAPGPAAVAYSLPFFPLMLWGIERARKAGQGAASVLAIGAAIAWSLLAGFPEPAYICGLLALAWGLYRLWREPRRARMLGRALGGFGLGLCVAAPLLISFVDYIGQSDSFKVHAVGDASLPSAAFSATLMPTIYGPAGWGFDSHVMAAIWGSIGGYTSLPVLLLALAGLLAGGSRKGLKWLLAAWVLVCWAKSFDVQPIAWIVGLVPLLGHSAFYRYAPPAWSFALIVLAACGLDDLRVVRAGWARDTRVVFGVVTGLLLLCVGLAWPGRGFWAWPRSHELAMFAVMGVSVGWSLVCLLWAWLAWGRRSFAALALLLIVDAALVFSLVQASGVRKGRVDEAAVAFLKEHQGLQRNYTFGPLGGNYAAYFGLASLNHNVLPVPKLWADYIDANLLPGFLDRSKGVIFDPSWEEYGKGEGRAALTSNLAHYREMAMRYVITAPQQGGTDAGTGVSALPRHARLKRALAWAHRVLDDPGSLGFERRLAQKTIGILQKPEVVEAGSAGSPRIPDAIDGLKRVYQDDLVNIYEVPGAAPYFQVIAGGPCVLSASAREVLTARCTLRQP